MEKMNVKTGDTVVVITGKDAGTVKTAKTGKVLKVYPKTGRIVVQGVNMITKHHKARSAQDKSEKQVTEGTIDASNVMIICPKCGKATRVKHAVVDGKKVRVCKCGSSLDEKVKVEKKAASKKSEAKAVEAKAEEVKAEPKTTKKPADTKAPAKTATKAAPKAEANVKATKTAANVKKATAAKSSQRGV